MGIDYVLRLMVTFKQPGSSRSTQPLASRRPLTALYSIWHFLAIICQMLKRLLREDGPERAFLEKLDIFKQNPGLLEKLLIGSEVSLAVLDLFLTRLGRPWRS